MHLYACMHVGVHACIYACLHGESVVVCCASGWSVLTCVSARISPLSGGWIDRKMDRWIDRYNQSPLRIDRWTDRYNQSPWRARTRRHEAPPAMGLSEPIHRQAHSIHINT